MLATFALAKGLGHHNASYAHRVLGAECVLSRVARFLWLLALVVLVLSLFSGFFYRLFGAVLKNSTIARDVKIVKDDSAAARQNGLLNSTYG